MTASEKNSKPLVGVIMGSKSDWPTMKCAATLLEEFDVPHETLVVSAHRTPARMVDYAKTGQRIVRLKSGAPDVFGRLDEEVAALGAAGVAYDVTPGITAASAAVAGLGVSLTQRGRNSGLRIVTGHDAKGFAEQDWRDLARPGAVAAIYMGKRAARFLTGRLMMHGAAPDTPVSVVENVSRADERIVASDLIGLVDALADVTGPAVLLLGIAPQTAIPAALREAL